MSIATTSMDACSAGVSPAKYASSVSRLRPSPTYRTRFVSRSDTTVAYRCQRRNAVSSTPIRRAARSLCRRRPRATARCWMPESASQPRRSLAATAPTVCVRNSTSTRCSNRCVYRERSSDQGTRT